jgi:hypothetical protein
MSLNKKQKKPIKDQSRLNSALGKTRYGVRQSGAVTDAKINEMNNAICYVRQILNPEVSLGELARLPEPTPFPSSVSRTKFLNVLSTITDAGTGGASCGGICVRPFMNGHFQGLTAYNSTLGTETWTANAHPQLANYTSNFYLWRCVGLSVRVYCTTPLLSRGGTLFMFRNIQNLDTFSGMLPVTSMLNSPEYCSFDLANLGAEGIMLPWLPITLQSSVGTSNTRASGSNQPTGSAYRIDVNGQNGGEDSFIGFFYTAPAANPQILNFEITGVWETIPVIGARQLFSLKAVPGSTDDIATALDVVDKNVGARSTSTTSVDALSQLVGGVGSFVKGAGSAVERVINIGKEVWNSPITKGISQVGSSLISLMGGMGPTSAPAALDFHARVHLASLLEKRSDDLSINAKYLDPSKTEDELFYMACRDLIDELIAAESKVASTKAIPVKRVSEPDDFCRVGADSNDLDELSPLRLVRTDSTSIPPGGYPLRRRFQ